MKMGLSAPWPRTIAMVTGRSVVLLAAVVLVGWWLEIPRLKSILPDWPNMSPLTAATFILSGFALGCLATATPAKPWIRRAAQFLTALVMAISFYKLSDFLFDWNARLDSLGFHDSSGSVVQSPMALATAANFLVLGVAMLLAGGLWMPKCFQLLTLSAILVSWLGFTRFLFGGTPAPPFGIMAIHSDVCFLLLGTGILCLRPDCSLLTLLRSDTTGGALMRRLILPVLLVPSLLAWIESQINRRGIFSEGMQAGLFTLDDILILGAIVWFNAASLHRADLRRRRIEETNTQLAAIVEFSADAIISKDLNSVVTSWNHGAEMIFGFTAGEIIGTLITRLIPLDRLHEEVHILGKIARGENVEHFETLRLTRDGRLIAVAITASPIKDARGRITGVSKVARDITVRKQMEAALREREEQLRLFAEHNPAAIAMLDREMRYLIVSRRWLADFRLGGQSIIGRSHYEIFPEIPQRWIEVHRRCLAGAMEKCEAEAFPRADGTIDWIHWEVWPWRQADGSVGGIIIFSEDITQSRLAAEELRASEARLRMVTDNAQVGLVMVDRNRCYTFANASYAEMLGLDSSNLIGRRVADVLAPVYEAQIRPRLDRAFAGESVTYELHRPLPGGDRHYMVRYEPTSVEGAVLRVVVVLTNITERKRAEAELLWKTAFLEAQVNSSSDGILVVNSQNRKILQNSRFVDLFKLPPEMAEEVDDTKLMPHITSQVKHPRQFLELVAHLYAHPEKISRDEIEMADGMILDRYSSPVRDQAGKYYGRIWAFRDISERRKLEAQVRQSQKMEGIGQLAGGVAHDFNNILAVIQMQAELLKGSGVLTSEQMEYADEIGTTVQRAAALTRQLLLFSRREVFQPRDLDLGDSILNTVKLLKRTLGENIEIELKLAAQPMFVHADGGMIDQILLNLAVNARDAMPGGGRLVITTTGVELDDIAASQIVKGRAGLFVCLGMSDNGCGIQPEFLAKIFEPFFTTKGVGKGTGLGLATVFGIVEQHQGWINVESTVGQGTAFRIYLPRLARLAGATLAPTTAPALRGGTETILLVEDDPALRVSVRKALAQLGYRILEAPTGVQALEIWHANRTEIRLLVTDLVMPDGMTGLDLAKRLLQETPKLKVIYLSGYSAEVAGPDSPLKEGVNFLPKPFQSHRLTELVRQTLDIGPA